MMEEQDFSKILQGPGLSLEPVSGLSSDAPRPRRKRMNGVETEESELRLFAAIQYPVAWAEELAVPTHGAGREHPLPKSRESHFSVARHTQEGSVQGCEKIHRHRN